LFSPRAYLTNIRRRISNYLDKVVLLFLLLYLAFYLVFATSSLLYPYQIDYGEGFLLNQAKMLSEGKNIYKDISEEPFIISNYPPLYPLLWSLFVKLFGVSFFSGRIISIISCLTISALIYKIVLKNTNNKKVAITSALIFLASPYVYSWSTLARVDMLGLLLSILGIYLVLTGEERKVLLSIPIFIASFFTKQFFVMAPIAAFVYLVLRREKKLALKFGFLFLISLAALFSALNYFTENQFFLHVVLYNANPFSIHRAISCYIAFIRIHWGLVLLSLYYLLVVVVTKERGENVRLLLIYFILSSLFALTVGKVGSSINYFLEVIAVSSVLSGLSIKRITNSDNERYKDLLFVILIIQMVSFAHAPFISHSWSSVYDLESNQMVSEQIRNMNKVLSENGGILVINGKEIYFMPFEFTQLAIQGIWDDEKIVKEIRDKSFEAIILEFNIDCIDKPYKVERFTPKMIESIKENYYLARRIGRFFIYLPNPES